MVVTEAISIYLGIIINGLLTGIGVAVGTWLAQKHILSKLEKKIDELKNVT